MSKHTPGPWTVAEGDGCFVVETDNSFVRFECMGLDAEGDRANACLIAAAPDLLAALKTLVITRSTVKALPAATAAITKATGGQQ